MPRFNVFQILCNLIIGLLRPFSLPLEMFCQEDVGERYPGFSALAALLTLESWCLFSDEVFPLHALMLGFVVRLIVHRVTAIRHRLRGESFIPTRQPGRPILARLIPQLPEQLLGWLQPIALLVASAAMCLLSNTLGTYLLCASSAWLIITIIRALADYNRVLDEYDADPQARPAMMEGRRFEVIAPRATIPAPVLPLTEELPPATEPMPLCAGIALPQV